MTERAAQRRLDAVGVAALAIPIVAVVAALGVRADAPAHSGQPPTEQPLSSATIVCPPGGRQVVVAGASNGMVQARSGEQAPAEIDLTEQAPSLQRVGTDAVVVRADGEVSRGLVATRFSTPLASVECQAPVFDQWFTGLGAGARHRSTIQLTNPDAGRAVVDVRVFSQGGEIAAPQLRGIAVRGGESRTFELAQVLPRRDDIAVRVSTVRGRISASVVDSFAEIDAATRAASDSLPGQQVPATENLLWGIPEGRGERILVLANTTENEGRATLKVVSGQSTFAPEGLDDVTLPPFSVVRVAVAPMLRAAAGADGAERDRPLGLLVESTVAATAGMAMFVNGDLTHTAPVAPLEAPALTPLPEGRKEVIVGAALRQNTVEVRLFRANGTELDPVQVAVAPDQAAAADLPAAARLMLLTPGQSPVQAVVLATGDGVTVVRPHVPAESELVPAVRPALR